MNYQTYFKKRIMQRFMSEAELRDFHAAYRLANTRPVPDVIDTYRIEVIERFLPGFKFAEFYSKYQDAKVPTTQNLHYGKDMETLVRRIVKEELDKVLVTPL